jgi:TRAP-type uncharacterized transport system substrate-binding protein
MSGEPSSSGRDWLRTGGRIAAAGAGLGLVMGLTYSLTTPATMAAWEEWTERFRRPVAMTLASGFRDAAIHVLGKELQAELQRVHGDRLTMTVLPTDGTPENARLLRDGRAQLGFISSGADVSFDGLRSLAVIERQFVHAIVPVGSAVTQLADLKGRRVSLGPADGAPYRFGLELRRFYQDRDKAFDFTIVETSAPLLQRDLLADLDAGRFDAAIRITPLHGANVQRPLASGRDWLRTGGRMPLPGRASVW